MRNLTGGKADISESSKLLHISIFWKKIKLQQVVWESSHQVSESLFCFCLLLMAVLGVTSQKKGLFSLNIRSAFLQFRISSFHGVFRAALESTGILEPVPQNPWNMFSQTVIPFKTTLSCV